MTIYVFRVWLQPNPLLGFEPDEEVWRDIEINGSHTLAAFHEAIFDAFKRWDSHAYEFITRDKEGIALRSYVHPHLYDGGVSWPPMDDGEIGRFIDRAVPDDAAAEAKERFRDLQRNPRRKATPRTRRSRNSTPNNWARSPTFDMGTVGNTPSTFRKPVRDRWMVAPLSSTNREKHRLSTAIWTTTSKPCPATFWSCCKVL